MSGTTAPYAAAHQSLTVYCSCRLLLLLLLLLSVVLVVMPLMRSYKQTPTHKISAAISYSFKNAGHHGVYQKETHGATH